MKGSCERANLVDHFGPESTYKDMEERPKSSPTRRQFLTTSRKVVTISEEVLLTDCLASLASKFPKKYSILLRENELLRRPPYPQTRPH
ncbi:unnamed protein product [Tenebrio molitor]|jgi:hypothetical protein|nr:unnamed protein product [Tenebrio molitor]